MLGRSNVNFIRNTFRVNFNASERSESSSRFNLRTPRFLPATSLAVRIAAHNDVEFNYCEHVRRYLDGVFHARTYARFNLKVYVSFVNLNDGGTRDHRHLFRLATFCKMFLQQRPKIRSGVFTLKIGFLSSECADTRRK